MAQAGTSCRALPHPRAAPPPPPGCGREGRKGRRGKQPSCAFEYPPPCPLPAHPVPRPAAGREGSGAGAGSEPDSRRGAGGRAREGQGEARGGAGPRADRWAKLGRNLNPRSEVRAWRTAASAGAARERGPAAGKRGAREPEAERGRAPSLGARDPAGLRALTCAPGLARPLSAAGKVGGTWRGRTAQPAERGSGSGSCCRPPVAAARRTTACSVALPLPQPSLPSAAPFAVRAGSCAPEPWMLPVADPPRP